MRTVRHHFISGFKQIMIRLLVENKLIAAGKILQSPEILRHSADSGIENTPFDIIRIFHVICRSKQIGKRPCVVRHIAGFRAFIIVIAAGKFRARNAAAGKLIIPVEPLRRFFGNAQIIAFSRAAVQNRAELHIFTIRNAVNKHFFLGKELGIDKRISSHRPFLRFPIISDIGSLRKTQKPFVAGNTIAPQHDFNIQNVAVDGIVIRTVQIMPRNRLRNPAVAVIVVERHACPEKHHMRPAKHRIPILFQGRGAKIGVLVRMIDHRIDDSLRLFNRFPVIQKNRAPRIAVEPVSRLLARPPCA